MYFNGTMYTLCLYLILYFVSVWDIYDSRGIGSVTLTGRCGESAPLVISRAACNSHSLALPPALRRCAYLLDTHIREMQSSLPSPQRCIINGFFCGGIRRCNTGHRLPIGTYSDDLACARRKRPTSLLRKSRNGQHRHETPLTEAESGALPPGEEGRERYLRHADSAWTNRKYDVAPSPERPAHPLSLPFSRDFFSPRVFLSLFPSLTLIQPFC